MDTVNPMQQVELFWVVNLAKQIDDWKINASHREDNIPWKKLQMV